MESFMKFKGDFFIVGAPRSGTTLLRDILKQVDHIYSPEETHFFRWSEPFKGNQFYYEYKKNIVLRKHRDIDGISEKEFEEILHSSNTKQELTVNYCQKVASEKDSNFWFEKTPQNIYGLPLIATQSKSNKVIHIVRNPYDVIKSLLVGKVIKVNDFVGAVNYWYEAVCIVEAIKPFLGDRLLEIKYEDLISDPATEMRKVNKFMGVDFEYDLENIKNKTSNPYSYFDKTEITKISHICQKYMKHYGYFDISEFYDLKLVIWDLDDTFWKGTISENGNVSLLNDHINLIKNLSEKGVMSSICSKNDFEQVRSFLSSHNLFEYFVFPSINWNSKGKRVLDIIDKMGLRSVNCIFIDDNFFNIEEVKHTIPEIKVASPSITKVLGYYVESLPIDGTKRLQRYKILEKKAIDKIKHETDYEFLHQSKIEIKLDYHIDNHIDRIVEIINRTNQINFTKKRLLNKNDISAFKKKIDSYGYVSCVVFAKDRYGDHGLIGFYLLKNHFNDKELEHFAFSCRILNMGIESYIYEKLGKPKIKYKQPIAYTLDKYEGVNWITERSDNVNHGSSIGSNKNKFLLLGGCELLQLESYLNGDFLSFVNEVDHLGMMVRYDDPYFLLNSAYFNELDSDDFFNALPVWKVKKAISFKSALKERNVIILGLSGFLRGDYYSFQSGAKLRLIHPHTIYAKEKYSEHFNQKLKKLSFNLADRVNLLKQFVSKIILSTKNSTKIFIIGDNDRTNMSKHEYLWRKEYNKTLMEISNKESKVEFIDTNTLVKIDDVIEMSHYNRRGYYSIAAYILKNYL